MQSRRLNLEPNYLTIGIREIICLSFAKKRKFLIFAKEKLIYEVEFWFMEIII